MLKTSSKSPVDDSTNTSSSNYNGTPKSKIPSKLPIKVAIPFSSRTNTSNRMLTGTPKSKISVTPNSKIASPFKTPLQSGNTATRNEVLSSSVSSPNKYSKPSPSKMRTPTTTTTSRLPTSTSKRSVFDRLLAGQKPDYAGLKEQKELTECSFSPALPSMIPIKYVGECVLCLK